MIRMLLSFWYREDIFHVGISSPAFRNKMEGQSAFLACAFSQMPLTPNNQYAKVVYLGVTFSGLPQLHGEGKRPEGDQMQGKLVTRLLQ